MGSIITQNSKLAKETTELNGAEFIGTILYIKENGKTIPCVNIETPCEVRHQQKESLIDFLKIMEQN